jgi:ketosteroid isomerase-like protein
VRARISITVPTETRVYHALIRRQVRGVFDSLSRGDYDAALAGVADDVHHVFAGDHALGGERHSKEAMRRWFERLDRLFPELTFEVTEVIAKGWPWNTAVAVEWSAKVRPREGKPYVNHATHFIRMRWGRVVYLHAYEDSQKVAEACQRMAERGVAEAAAVPITG